MRTGSHFAQAQAYFANTANHALHTDVAVARRPNEVEVIGANMRDLVTGKPLHRREPA